MLRFFLPSIIISVVVLGANFIWGGWSIFLLALLLSILEVTLSFDNAVVNAKVLKNMNEKWQKRFLTWGILIAVFGTRLVLPVLIVSVSAWVSPVLISSLALFNPAEYAHLLEDARYSISAFGGLFLLMVSLKYFFDVGKEVHWVKVVEKRLAEWGRIEAIEIAVALMLLLAFAFLAETHKDTILIAGIIGIALFIFVQGIANAFSFKGKDLAASGAVLFIYLNILDSAFSLDGVVGAFAITSNLPVIVAGLGIGAYFVRSITVYLVRKKALESLVYLEHGAHWAILGLAVSMLVGLLIHVPEAITGLIGLAFVVAAYISSLRYKQKES